MNIRHDPRLSQPLALLLALVLTLVSSSPPRLFAETGEEPPDPDGQESTAKAGDGKNGDPLAPLGPDQLPRRTRVPPDPSKSQFVRDPVFVRIGEVIISSSGEEELPEVQVVDLYLQEYLRRAGFTIAVKREKSRYRIEGEVFSEHYKDLKVQGQTVAYKVRAECSFFVLDPDGNALESFDVPEVYRENVKSEESAFLHLRRYVASLLWEHLRMEGGVFSDAEVRRELAALCASNSEGTTEEVVQRLADRGLSVVPYMIEALSDTRGVLMKSSYPGLDEETRARFKVFHVADKVLEEIFQKVSRMSLATTEKGRFRVIRGWEQEWRRFCPPFRDSPNAPRGESN